MKELIKVFVVKCYGNTLKLVFKTGLLDVSNINLPSKFGVCMIPKSDPW